VSRDRNERSQSRSSSYERRKRERGRKERRDRSSSPEQRNRHEHRKSRSRSTERRSRRRQTSSSPMDTDENKKVYDDVKPHVKKDERSDEGTEAWQRKRQMHDPKAQYFKWRREQRIAVADAGVRRVWSRSPSPVDTKIDDDKDTVDGESKKERKHRRKEKKKDKKEKKKKTKKEKSSSEEEDEWVEITRETLEHRAELAGESDDDDVVIGPKLPGSDKTSVATTSAGGKRMDYGKDIRKSEAEAIAAYIKEGKRIPRRGEIGLSTDDIEMYEKMGYVMSGSRHRRMEATRTRIENQVYSAEEKRMLATFGTEERQKREQNVLHQFKTLIQQKKDKH